MDLNPLTTPDNVLTDCVNGTFVTFNGDELALQTDAGNQPLTTLSDGFYPIGVKEYGGVLYIVSGKKPDFEPGEFDDSQTYNKGRVVYITNSGLKTYYESLEDGNIYAPSIGTTEYWLYVGDENSFINRYGKIEFGSYPSIGISDDTLSALTSYDYAFNSASQPLALLEKYQLIVKNFSPGCYINFTDGTQVANLANISYNSYDYNSYLDRMVKNTTNSKKKIYRVVVMQKINNGFRNLTEEIWDQYARYLRSTQAVVSINSSGHSNSWLADPNFKFYAPDNYTGDLFILTELEPFDSFNVGYVVSEGTTSNIKVTFTLNYVNNTAWNPVGCPKYVDIVVSKSGIPNFNPTESDDFLLFTNVAVNDIENRKEVYINVPNDYNGFILNYKIRQLFTFGVSCTAVAFNEFPEDFVNKHTISGQIKVITNTGNYILAPDMQYAICDGTAQLLTSFSVIDRTTGKYINNNWEVSDTPFSFCLAGSDAAQNAVNLLGTYEVNSQTLNPFNIILEELYDEFASVFTLLLQNSIARDPNSNECTFYKLEIITNKVIYTSPGVVRAPFRVTQENDVITLGHVLTTNKFICYVKKNIQFHIMPVTDAATWGFDTDVMYYYSGTISADTTLYYAMVTKVEKVVTEIPGAYSYSLKTLMNSSTFGGQPVTGFNVSWRYPSSGPFLNLVNIVSGESDYFLEDYGFNSASFQLVFNTGTTDTNTYCNLGTPNVDYVSRNTSANIGHIFKKVTNI